MSKDQKLHDLSLFLKKKGHSGLSSRVEGLIEKETPTQQISNIAASFQSEGKFGEAEILDNFLKVYADLSEADRADTNWMLGDRESLPGDQRQDLTSVEQNISNVKANLASKWEQIQSKLTAHVDNSIQEIEGLLGNIGTVDGADRSDVYAKKMELMKICQKLSATPDKFGKIFEGILSDMKIDLNNDGIK